LDNDSVVVFRVSKHIPAAKAPLVQVSEYITKKLALQEAEKRAKQLGIELLANEEGSAQEKLMQANQLQWHGVDKATRDTDKVDMMVNDLAFNLPRTNSCDGRSLSNGDYVIVRLKRINDGRLSLLDKEQQAGLAQQIEANYGLMDYDLYVNNLVHRAKVGRHN
jgi:peptidyl-prolyl cis-trans isomerase D